LIRESLTKDKKKKFGSFEKSFLPLPSALSEQFINNLILSTLFRQQRTQAAK
jgi:hypothetical protein